MTTENTRYSIHVILTSFERDTEDSMAIGDPEILEEEEVAGCRDEYLTEESARAAFSKVKKSAEVIDRAFETSLDPKGRRQIVTNAFQLGVIRKALAALPVEALTAEEHAERQMLVDMASDAIDSTPEIIHGWVL